MKSFRAFVVELEEKKLVGGQKELDHDKDGDIDGSDFAMMRKKKKNEDTDPSTASEIELTKLKDPSGGRACSYRAGRERRAFERTSSILRGASGSGSKILTSEPINKNRATQPPPITPPPITANCTFLASVSVDLWFELVIAGIV